mmetsp:Transcript_15819/g.45578  ORF Transcript_15819/g.45578 Transcript_15819/m.45578 type:complete len:332 (+) Transcript_15819:51-1046(+)
MIRPLPFAIVLLLLSEASHCSAFGALGHSTSCAISSGAQRRTTISTNALNSRTPKVLASGASRQPFFSDRPRISTLPTKSALKAVVVDVVNEFFLTQPYTAAALTCGVKASAADYVAQRRHLSKRDGTRDEIEISEEGTEQEVFEVPRNVAFLLYGVVYQGMGQELIYNHLYSAWFGSGTGPAVVATKVAFDLLIQTTLLTLPVAYLTKAAIFRYSPAEGLRRYIEDITTHGLLLKYFALWGPVQCLTFSVVPIQARVPFIALVSFFWLIILSSISSRPRQAELNASEATLSDSKAPLVQFDGMDDNDLSEAIDGDDECLLADGYTCSIDG